MLTCNKMIITEKVVWELRSHPCRIWIIKEVAMMK